MKNIFEKQLGLQRVIATNYGYKLPNHMSFNKGEMVDYVKEHAFYLNEEIRELILAIGDNDSAIYKTWKANHIDLCEQTHYNTKEIQYEAIDMLCFCINICLGVGINDDNVERLYNEVLERNLKRQQEGY